MGGEPAAAVLGELQEQLRDVQARLAALENRVERSTPPVPGPRPHGPTTPDAGPTGPAIPPAAPGSPELRQQVEQALQSIRADEALARDRGKLEHAARLVENRLQRLTPLLGLSATQVDQLRAVFTAHEQRNLEITRLWEQNPDPVLVGEAKRRGAEDHARALAAVLTPTQLEQLQQAERPAAGK